MKFYFYTVPRFLPLIFRKMLPGIKEGKQKKSHVNELIILRVIAS